jgi:hypothetical protein
MEYKFKDDLVGEIWKPVTIDSYKDYYLVSNLGNVKGLNYRGLGLIRNLIPQKNQWGYLRLTLQVNKKPKSFVVHKLVALAFKSNPENKKEVNHINGIKSDNRIENLEWVTPSENMAHAKINGLLKNKKSKRKKPIIQKDINNNFIKRFDSITSASLELGIHSGRICRVCKGNRLRVGDFKFEYENK